MNKIYADSILTFAFTNKGQIVTRKDKKGKIDTLPWLFMGYREKDSKTDYEDSIWIINSMDEYKERVTTFFAYQLRNSRTAILEGFFVGNSSNLLDVGELHEKIASRQIEEMKTIHTPSFIRINRGLYDSGINQNNQQVINRTEIRYIVLPSNINIEMFPELEAKTISELRGNINLVSNKIILGITGSNGEGIDSFINQLKSSNKDTVPKKLIKKSN